MKRGVQVARRMRDLVAQRMTPNQISEASALANSWKPTKPADSENLQGLALPSLD